jgi:hypothetical protein
VPRREPGRQEWPDKLRRSFEKGKRQNVGGE